jgi:putative sugar O-methyltransferase
MYNNFVRTIIKTITRPKYIAVRGLRSSSDAGYYPEIARRAAQNSSTFATFKRNDIYREVLEHVSKEQGAQYLEQIQIKWPRLIEDIEKFKINDEVGNPIRVTYPRIGEISPTTLRYLKVACDLRELFGELNGFDVVEIGGGYGGQFLLADRIWQLSSWTILDLDPVLQLITRYLECHLINSAYNPTTLNRFDSQTVQSDLAISNYAFSELPRPLQLKYISKVMSKAKRGYMTMNSGKTTGNGQSMTIDELRIHFPDVLILEEVPLTARENYILVWGQR